MSEERQTTFRARDKKQNVLHFGSSRAETVFYVKSITIKIILPQQN